MSKTNPVLCQVCGVPNPRRRESCAKCGHKLFVGSSHHDFSLNHAGDRGGLCMKLGRQLGVGPTIPQNPEESRLTLMEAGIEDRVNGGTTLSF